MLIVTALAYFLFVVVLIDLVERLRETYELFRLPISWPLATAVWVAETANRWWWIPPLGLALAIGWWMTTGGVQILRFSGPAQPLAWFPGVGTISRRFQLANFADLLALLVEHDVPLPESLRLSSDAVGDESLRQSVKLFANSAAQGNIGPGPAVRFGLPPFLYWVLDKPRAGFGLGSSFAARRVDLSSAGDEPGELVQADLPGRRGDRDRRRRDGALCGGAVWSYDTVFERHEARITMPKYAYIAIATSGARVSGEIEASDPDAAVSRLTAEGMRSESIISLPDIAPAAVELVSRLSPGEAPRDQRAHRRGRLPAWTPRWKGIGGDCRRVSLGSHEPRAQASCRRIKTRIRSGERAGRKRQPPHICRRSSVRETCDRDELAEILRQLRRRFAGCIRSATDGMDGIRLSVDAGCFRCSWVPSIDLLNCAGACRDLRRI